MSSYGFNISSKGLRVVMDVVYNHMYDYYTSAFERTVPGYYLERINMEKCLMVLGVGMI